MTVNPALSWKLSQAAFQRWKKLKCTCGVSYNEKHKRGCPRRRSKK